MFVRLADNCWQPGNCRVHLLLIQVRKLFERAKECIFRVDRHVLADAGFQGLSFPALILRIDASCLANSFLAIRSISGSAMPYSVKA